MRAHLWSNIRNVCASGQENAAQRCRLGNAVPWIETLVKIRAHGAHRIPKDRIDGLQEARTPCRDGELTSRTNALPKLAHGGPHVWYEENAEDADHRIKVGRRLVEV